MTNKEAIKYLIAPTATSTEPSAEYLKQKEAYDLAIKALEERPQDEGLTPWEQVCRIAQSCGYSGAEVRKGSVE